MQTGSTSDPTNPAGAQDDFILSSRRIEMAEKPSAKSASTPSSCQIVVVSPWLASRFVHASTAHACGVACPTARIVEETIESGHIQPPSMANVIPTTEPMALACSGDLKMVPDTIAALAPTRHHRRTSTPAASGFPHETPKA